jgi:D-alanyl-D-alanine carboxypeptidase
MLRSLGLSTSRTNSSRRACATAELMRFLRAFFGAELFSASALADMQAKWRKIFRPLQYGTGIMRFALPRYYSPLQPIPQMVGHSGASGAVAFDVPDLDLFVTGRSTRSRSAACRIGCSPA